jgi:hypothetical protein
MAVKKVNIYLIIFILCCINSLWALSIGWNNTILDYHGFRQTQTAISTYYIVQGGPWLAYETPILGYPWSIPFEFPLYQWIVAILVKIFCTPLDQTGRLVSALFFYLSLIPFYIILGCLNIPKYYRWIFLSLFLTSPLYLFWSRTFMIESAAFFFGIAYLSAVSSYFRQKTPISVTLATIFGVLGALVKITTFAGFALSAGFLTLSNASWQKNRKNSSDILFSLIIPAVAFALLPYVAISIWTHFADSQKLLNPIAESFTSKAMATWVFGTLEQRLSPILWKDILGRILHDLWGQKIFATILLITLPFFSKRNKFFFASIAAFFAVILTFTNLHIVHNYYQYANGVFLIAAICFCILGILEKKGLWKFLGFGIFALLLTFQISDYYTVWTKIAVKANKSLIIKTASAIQKYTNPNDIIFIYGLGFSSELPYYSQRRALMDNITGMALPDEPKMKAALTRLSEYKLGAMVFCGNKDSKRQKTARLTAAYHFPRVPVYSNSFYRVHLPFNRLCEIAYDDNFVKLRKNNLKSNDNKIVYMIDNNDNPIIRGWAFVDGTTDTKGSHIWVILKSKYDTYKIDTYQEDRNDITDHFNKITQIELNLDESGFNCMVPENIASGKYKIGLLIENNGLKSFEWTKEHFLKTVAN